MSFCGAAGGGQTVDVCTFWVGSTRMGMRLHDMKEIVPYRPLSKLPNRKVSALGVMSLRNELMPVYELNDILGLARVNETSSAGYFLVVDRAPVFAVRIDKVDAILHLQPESLQAPPEYARRHHVEHVVVKDGKHIPLLNFKASGIATEQEQGAWSDFMADLMNSELKAQDLIEFVGERQ